MLLVVFHVDNCSNYASHRDLYDLPVATDELEKLLLEGHTNCLIC